MPEFINSETESAVETIVKKQNNSKKTIQDVIDVVLAVNHDSVHRDADIIQNQKQIMCEHMEEHHRNDADVWQAYRLLKWAAAIVCAGILLLGINYIGDRVNGNVSGRNQQRTEMLQNQEKSISPSPIGVPNAQ